MSRTKDHVIEMLNENQHLFWVNDLMNDFIKIIEAARAKGCEAELPPDENNPELVELFEIAKRIVDESTEAK